MSQTAKRNLLGEFPILVMATVIEVALAVAALAGITLFEVQVSWNINVRSSLFGIVAAVLLFSANTALLALSDRGRYPFLEEFSRFRDEIAAPLARQLRTSSALALSILAGLCEELFFRGFLQPLLGILLTGTLFSLLHFGPRVKEWKLLAAVYLLVSLYFSSLLLLFNSLWSAVLAHAMYDTLALFRLKSR